MIQFPFMDSIVISIGYVLGGKKCCAFVCHVLGEADNFHFLRKNCVMILTFIFTSGICDNGFSLLLPLNYLGKSSTTFWFKVFKVR